MTNEQWERLVATVNGDESDPLPVGFIIDSPWLPNWAGMSILDYYVSGEKWFEANMQAIRQFPDIMFLPGFWAEYGMCTEPAAFGAKTVWHENEFPFADKVVTEMTGYGALPKPDPRTDGLCPFVLKLLEQHQPRIEAEGHAIRFAVARGPLNIAGFLMGNTEFLMAMKMNPDEIHALLKTITAFLVEWLHVQKERFPSIDGIMLLDDVVGFVDETDFTEFVKPYLTEAFAAFPASVRLFHNDAHGLVCAPHLKDVGVNLFNFAFDHPIADVQRLVGDEVALLGNIPPRDVLAQGTPDDVTKSVDELISSLPDKRRVILSCGGGMPPDVKTENIDAFLRAAGY
ncbi:MAG: uroporphyrinogen decarboxylase [bacterium]|nr:uroporphyrinogen decarboxylase [bacterium]